MNIEHSSADCKCGSCGDCRIQALEAQVKWQAQMLDRAHWYLMDAIESATDGQKAWVAEYKKGLT